MIISDLSYMETVSETANIEGGRRRGRYQSNSSYIFQYGEAFALAIGGGKGSSTNATAYVNNTANVTQSNDD